MVLLGPSERGGFNGFEERGVAYQSAGIGAIDTEQSHGGSHVLGGRGVGPDAIEGGSARNGELLDGGAQTSAGDASGEHCDGGDQGRGRRRDWVSKRGGGDGVSGAIAAAVPESLRWMKSTSEVLQNPAVWSRGRTIRHADFRTSSRRPEPLAHTDTPESGAVIISLLLHTIT